MKEKQLDTKETPIEELQCCKKYIYDTGIIFECKNNCKSQIIGEDIVDLLNELTTKCSQLKKENEQLKKSNQKLNDELQETMGYLALKSGVEKENEQLKQTIDTICKDYENHHGMDIRNADWFTAW